MSVYCRGPHRSHSYPRLGCALVFPRTVHGGMSPEHIGSPCATRKSPVTKYLTVQPRNCSVRATPNVPQLPHFRHDEPVHLPSSAFQAFVCAFDRRDAAREVTRMGGSLYLPLWSSEAFLVIQASPCRFDIQPRRVSP